MNLSVNGHLELDDFKMMNKMLGVGAFGAVQLAKNIKNNNLFALKVINLAKLEGSVEKEMTKKEVILHSKAHHKNIIKLYGVMTKNQMLYHILEYAENGTLYHLIKKKTKLTENQIFRYFYQTVQAIRYLHENDIMHRDIKPENLLIDKNNSIKLCDFGWSDSSIKEYKRQFCGTYEYMAPEIVDRKPHNYKVDIWSMGILLYEMVYGHTPFNSSKSNRDKREILECIKKGDLRFNEPISEDIKNLIQALLVRDPYKRLEISGIMTHKWVQKKLFATMKINECLQSGEIKKKIHDPPSIIKKLNTTNDISLIQETENNHKKSNIPVKFRKMNTTSYVTVERKNSRTNIFDKNKFPNVSISMNEIISVLTKPPMSTTKNKSLMWNSAMENTSNRIFTEENETYVTYRKEKEFKKNMMESLEGFDKIEKRKKSVELSIISEFSDLDIFDEAIPNKVNLFPKSNINDELLLKFS